MNTTNIIKLVACLAWAGVAVSSATPANAKALTQQMVGQFGTCSSSYSAAYYDGGYNCNFIRFNYSQNIKFVVVSCSSGACTTEMATTYVESLYATGRKVAVNAMSCGGQGTLVDMGSCAC
jgi:hypothetical protein